jgi:hypothetical protein
MLKKFNQFLIKENKNIQVPEKLVDLKVKLDGVAVGMLNEFQEDNYRIHTYWTYMPNYVDRKIDICYTVGIINRRMPHAGASVVEDINNLYNGFNKFTSFLTKKFGKENIRTNVNRLGQALSIFLSDNQFKPKSITKKPFLESKGKSIEILLKVNTVEMTLESIMPFLSFYDIGYTGINYDENNKAISFYIPTYTLTEALSFNLPDGLLNNINMAAKGLPRNERTIEFLTQIKNDVNMNKVVNSYYGLDLKSLEFNSGGFLILPFNKNLENTILANIAKLKKSSIYQMSQLLEIPDSQ